jgi:hypothetical protein
MTPRQARPGQECPRWRVAARRLRPVLPLSAHRFQLQKPVRHDVFLAPHPRGVGCGPDPLRRAP